MGYLLPETCKKKKVAGSLAFFSTLACEGRRLCFHQHRAKETMANKQPLKTTFDVNRVLRPIFTGGSVSIDSNARILATTLGDDAVLTDPVSGKHLCDIEGVSSFPSPLILRYTSSNIISGWRANINFDL